MPVSETIQNIIEILKSLTVMELPALVRAVEKEFGVDLLVAVKQ